MGDKMAMLKIGMGLVSHIEPILKEIVEIKNKQTHGKQELISQKNKHYAIYREFFELESDAVHFVSFCNQIYAMKPDQLPPIHILLNLFKLLFPIITPKKLAGEQTHGKPLMKKMDNGQTVVILKECFTAIQDAKSHLSESEEIKRMRF